MLSFGEVLEGEVVLFETGVFSLTSANMRLDARTRTTVANAIEGQYVARDSIS